MSTEVWFRNPFNYIRELVEVGESHIVWDRGLLVKKRIDPVKHAELYFGKTFDYRVLLVGEQGTAELRPGDTLMKPSAVYPTWVYGEDAALLEEIAQSPPGEDAKACLDLSVPPDERPVWGQENRIVIVEFPPAHTGPGRRFLRYLKELQEEYPKSIIHVHGMYGWKSSFGMGLGAADVEPRAAAQKGKVHLPSGREVPYEHCQANAKWVTALGFKPVDLDTPRVRCMYNIKSALWAGQHYEELFQFPHQERWCSSRSTEFRQRLHAEEETTCLLRGQGSSTRAIDTCATFALYKTSASTSDQGRCVACQEQNQLSLPDSSIRETPI